MISWAENEANGANPGNGASVGTNANTAGGSFSLGDAQTLNQAAGWSSSTSESGKFVELINKAAETKPQLKNIRYGVVPALTGDYGSAAYVSADYDGLPLFGIVLFERGASLRPTETNGHEDYFTITSLANEEVIKAVAATIKEQYSLSTDPVFVITNTVPSLHTTEMTIERALSIMGQITTTIFGRVPGLLGSLKISKNDKFTATVGSMQAAPSPIDVNGHAARADLGIRLQHVPTNVTNTPTLLSGNNAQQYPDCAAAAYVNLRYVGPKKDQANNGTFDAKQITPEVVISLMDSSTLNAVAPFERQILMLNSATLIASMGGWKDFIKSSLDKSRKLSALAQNLIWGPGMDTSDMKALDKPENVDTVLNYFCHDTAAVVVSHRAGNGIGGLSSLLAEIAQGKPNSLKQLLNILDNMFPKIDGKSFSQVLSTAFQNSPALTSAHIISATIPTISGVYRGPKGLASLADMDLLSVATYTGDKRADFLNYLHAQSYNNRVLTPKQQRIYLMKLAAGMFSANDMVVTGESIDMIVNPTFGSVLQKFTEHAGNFQIYGVNSNLANSDQAFYNNSGELFNMSGIGGVAANTDFGLNQFSSQFNL